MAPWKYASLCSLASALILLACDDWPAFEYAASPTQDVWEVENPEGEVVQNLHEIHGSVRIAGQISDSGYVVTSVPPPPFGLPGWYLEDMDWYQFWLRSSASMALELTFAEHGLLDLYFCEVDPATSELSLLENAFAETAPSLTLSLETLHPDTAYVVAVAGRVGAEVDYVLLLDLNEPE